MKNNDTGDHAVVAPIIASKVLGSLAYGSHKLDKNLDAVGIRKGLTLNPNAIDAIEAYGKYNPAGKSPSDFAIEYSRLAHNAGSAQLFNEDSRKVWEWEINNPEIRAKIPDKVHRLSDKTRRIASKINKYLPYGARLGRRIDRVADYIDSAASYYKPLSQSGSTATLAHIPEMAQSPLRSYNRLLMEVGSQANVNEVADNTLEALINYSKPSYARYKGKVFNSPEEYFNQLVGNTGKSKIDGLYKKYLDSFKADVVKNPTNRLNGLRDVIVSELLPNTYRNKNISFFEELNKVIGNNAGWKLRGENLVNVKQPKFRPGIRTAQDIADIAERHAGLKFLNATATGYYRNASKTHTLPFKVLKALQLARNKKLRMILGAGSLLTGGLGALNIYRNRKEKNS